MASTNTILRDQFPAGADLSTKKRLLVKLNSSGNLVLCGAGDAGFSLVNAPVSGEAGTVDLVGITKVQLGTGGCNAMDLLTSDANGKAVVATTGNSICLRALATGAANDIVPALIIPAGAKA
jgi:hypothetical protein